MRRVVKTLENDQVVSVDDDRVVEFSRPNRFGIVPGHAAGELFASPIANAHHGTFLEFAIGFPNSWQQQAARFLDQYLPRPIVDAESALWMVKKGDPALTGIESARCREE